MARHLQSHHHLPPISSTAAAALLLIAAVAAVASIVISLCTTHKHTKHSSKKNSIAPQRLPSDDHPAESNGVERKLVAALSGIGSKAMEVAKMVSWRRGEDVEDEEEVWRKSILMGVKCRPLDFSGQIVYDSDGREVAETTKHRSDSNGGNS